jgi:hypothetical protein
VGTSPQPPTRLASEDVIINAPMSYTGSAQRIFRLRRRALWLIPYRLLRRGARKRKAEALRHRELMGTIQGSAAASAAAIVTASTSGAVNATVAVVENPHIRVDADERERAATALHAHYVAGRLSNDELDERVALAYAARTRGDLASLLGDLPALPAGGLGTGV